ncbi:MAG: glycogen/starch/alpha-glucan phosphorylase [Acidobacteria bacterium]|nr:glycogen/starch/alpha-glucan phosphorylase [Acidobacteriota bacterium]
MPTETAHRPVHVIAAEAGSDRVPEMTGALHAERRTVLGHTLPPGVGPGPGDAEGERELLRREIALAENAARAALADDGVVLLADARAAMVVPEMMRVLLDEQAASWDAAWTRVRGATFTRAGSPGDQPGPLWPAELLGEECPRILEILYEINRRHLDEAEEQWPGDVDRRRNVSLFREGDPKRLRLGALAIVGAGRVEMAEPWEGPAAEILADLREMRGESLRPRPTPLRAERWLHEANAPLAAALTLALGERWRSTPETLGELESLAFEPAFRGAFRNARRANRQRLAELLRTTVGVETDPDALVDVRLGSMRDRERVLLGVLGLVREHLRITAGGWTPPAPRTVVIAREAGVSGPEAERSLAVARAVADAVNRDERARPALRVAVLPECPEPTVHLLAAAADLSNQAGTAGSGAAGARALGFAVNGAVTLGTRDGTVREIELAVGAENMFLFGLGPLEARAWRDGRVYRPKDVYAIDPLVRRALDELVSERYAPEPGALDWVRGALLDENDPWLVLADFGEYVHRQDEALAEFADSRTFAEKAILTLAGSRRFWAGSLEVEG